MVSDRESGGSKILDEIIASFGEAVAAAEIWEIASPGTQSATPNFKPTAFELMSRLITDLGIVGAGATAEVCAAVGYDESDNLIEKF